jgi:hypothetical protein
MTNRIEKSGLALFDITPALLNNLEGIKKRCKETHDEYSYETIGAAITGLTKTIALKKTCDELVVLLELSEEALRKAREHCKNLFPGKSDCQDILSK